MLIVSMSILLVGCGTGPKEILVLDLIGAEPLANDFHYEGWAIIDGEAKSTGKFNVDTLGNLIDTEGAVIANGEFDVGFDLKKAYTINITIEPAGDTNQSPSRVRFMGGHVSNYNANLIVYIMQVLYSDILYSWGNYILATPTNGDTTNELSGVWFINMRGDPPFDGLALPTIGPGWKYEGWVIINGQPVTSGKFTHTDMSDESAPYSGPQSGPPFPGEDYLENAPAGLTFPTDLSGCTVVISVEPDPDDGPGPFSIKPLIHQIPDPAIDHQTYDMINQVATFPTGYATIK